MSQKQHHHTNSPFASSKNQSSKGKNVQAVPAINISLKNNFTNKPLTYRDQFNGTNFSILNNKIKQISSLNKKTQNLVNSAYISGNYRSHSSKLNSRTKDLTSPSFTKSKINDSELNMTQMRTKPKTKPKSFDQYSTQQIINKAHNINKPKLPTEPSEMPPDKIASLFKKIHSKKNSMKSKSPHHSQSVEQNFKKILEQYQSIKMNTTMSSKQEIFKSKLSEQKLPYKTEESEVSGFNTERFSPNYPNLNTVIVLLFDKNSTITEYKFDSQTGTTDQLTTFLIQQLQSSISFIITKLEKIEGKIIGFNTIDQNVALDYYLSLKNKSLESLTNMIIKLQPLYAKDVTRMYLFLKDFEPISLKSFYFLQCIGMGGFSRVYLVRSKSTGHFIALKLISKQFIIENQKQSIVQNERDVMCQLTQAEESTRKRFICKLECAFETKTWVCFGMEYCPGGELFNQLRKVKRMNEDQARIYFTEVCIAIGLLHDNLILYRDIKPENILIDESGHIKVADFGLARPNMTSEDEAYSFCGSPEYMAPEMLQQQGHTYGVDFYCLGALLYELLTGLPPYYSRDTQQIFESILYQNLEFPSGIGSSEARDLIKRLLTKDPEKRLGSHGGIAGILKHPWVQKISLEKLLLNNYKPPFEPNLKEFNFDPNELKKGENQFKQELQRSLISLNELKFKPIFSGFQFISNNLKQQQTYPLTERMQTGKEEMYGENQSERRIHSGSQNSKKSASKGRNESAKAKQEYVIYITRKPIVSYLKKTCNQGTIQRRIQMQTSMRQAQQMRSLISETNDASIVRKLLKLNMLVLYSQIKPYQSKPRINKKKQFGKYEKIHYLNIFINSLNQLALFIII